MTAPAPLPLVCELRQASAGGCVARPVCLALGGRDPHCVLGFEDGAVAAWRTVRVPANGRDDAEIHHSGGGAAGGASGQLWMVTELAGSGGDTCPVDALAILSVGAVAVAHGGIQGKPIPRPPVVAVLCLATGRELRSLTLPMAWPDGGVCPVARLVAAGGEGGVAAVSAARIYRMGEGTQGFQGTFATMAVWSGSSLNASAVVQAGPQHRAPVGADVAGASRERHAAEPILAPFAGLATEERVSGGSGGLGTSVSTTTIVLRAAHVTLTSADGSLRLSFQEWHLVQSSPSSPGGGTLRPVRAVELPSFCLGGRSEMHMLRAEAGVEEDSAFGSSAAQRAGPAVAVWSHGCAATWAGCQPGAAVWRLPSDADDAIRKDGGGNSGGLGGRNGGGGDEGEDEQGGTGGVGKQYRASAALERCLAGATRRAAAVLPLRSGAGASAGVKRLLVLTHDHALLHVDTKLFMTAAVEPAPINIAAASEGAVGA
eukprot:CAMPEP_0181365248 /NCGR_PEP_ID=MMETSP1106-20121128/9943_1 /TAXON_ID=81844 /ORGANISM="Mantoniella antarctica, Strain SL-175" /LENGTH=485 /DNA_ID=CAMNT_0023480265 /DNA_START=28 /DNA_END=1482 /DNA_ORIENTATION=+